MYRPLRHSAGYTIMELLVALVLTGIVAAAGFSFYVSMHNSALTQEDISNMQHTARSSLQEIAKTLRMAGYELAGHAAYRISGDSLYVFFSDPQPVDTVLYYLQENTALGVNAPNGWKPMFLMKKVNNQPAAVFSDVVRSITYTVIDSANVQVSIEAQTAKSDESWDEDSGYRSFTATERVTIRNLEL